MDIESAIIYGIVQGLTEFLPVSSSGHLAVLHYFLHIEDPGIVYDLMMHLGTILAVLIYFRHKIFSLSKSLPQALLWKRRPALPADPKVLFIRYFLVSTLATFLVVLLLKKWALDYGRSHLVVAVNSIVFGILMYVADRKAILSEKAGSSAKTALEMESEGRFPKAIWIGLSQALAIFPGVSRSGITLTTSRFLHFSRKEATEYSFFLSLPIILAASLSKLAEVISLIQGSLGTTTTSSELSGLYSNWIVWPVGVLVSFLVGLCTIHYFLKWVPRLGLGVFCIYRILFALILFYFIQ